MWEAKPDADIISLASCRLRGGSHSGLRRCSAAEAEAEQLKERASRLLARLSEEQQRREAARGDASAASVPLPWTSAPTWHVAGRAVASPRPLRPVPRWHAAGRAGLPRLLLSSSLPCLPPPPPPAAPLHYASGLVALLVAIELLQTRCQPEAGATGEWAYRAGPPPVSIRTSPCATLPVLSYLSPFVSPRSRHV
ncbi:unnamed protein product [Prorocentrum cordatum]|uniref:Uncharacterized protein n=1 Tax=Prorocentrum cordatum TaxID=2364126 RepID=A0ABN9XNQ2_9DINO|nr:unnamed protein product [Polarella glacialis]